MACDREARHGLGISAHREYGGSCTEEQVGMVMGLWGGGETDALHNQFNVELRLGNQVCNEEHSMGSERRRRDQGDGKGIGRE